MTLFGRCNNDLKGMFDISKSMCFGTMLLLFWFDEVNKSRCGCLCSDDAATLSKINMAHGATREDDWSESSNILWALEA